MFTFLAIAMLGAGAVLLAVGYVKKQFVKPVESISAETKRFATENAVGKPFGEISNISELSALAESVNRLETDMVRYMEDLTVTTAEKERLATEFALANKIQDSQIPHNFPAFPERNEFDIYGSMSPARMVGGDFFDFMLIDDDHLAMWIGDVSGKGVPAALFMMNVNLRITERTRQGGTPAEILSYVNNAVCKKNDAEMFVTVWLGILELSTGKLTATNAGHVYPAIGNENGFEMLNDKHGLFVGGYMGIKYTDYELQLSHGSKMFIYSDGVTEAKNSEGEMFMTERMLGALNDCKNGSPENVISSVKKAVDNFVSSAPQFDDLTMLCPEYKGKNS